MTQKLFIFVLTLLFVEIGLQVFFRLDGARFGFWNPRDYVVSKDETERIETKFDPALGWKNTQVGFRGEREAAKTFDSPEVLTYGDSFVYGDEVKASETWQAFLAENLRKDVLNFGVNAYGMDQALLSYENGGSLPRVSWVILGFTPSGINRIVNAYRKFLFHDTGVPMTKPRFVLAESGLSLLPNPISSKQDLGKLQDGSFIEGLCAMDLWCSEVLRSREVGFPAFLRLLRPEFWSHLRTIASANEFRPTGEVNLWEREEALKLVDGIFARFSKVARERGSHALFLVLPERDDTDAFLKNEFNMGKLWALCRNGKFLCLDGVSPIGIEAEKRGGAESLHASGGHLSSDGNRLIADLLLGALKTKSRRE